MELLDAIGRISEIRAHMNQTQTFRGFRSLTVGFSGVLGIAAAVVQGQAMARSAFGPLDFMGLWVGVAVISVLVVGAELAYRCSIESSPLKRRLTLLAVQQFAPCLVAGALVTAAFAVAAPGNVWMLPGLWAVLFSLGVFASCRLLPKATFWVAVHYLAAGVTCLTFGPAGESWTAWMMLGTFGVGQLLAAGILYYTLERSHDRPVA